MHNTGQDAGTADADVDAPEAWDLTTGSSSVVVGVIDSGVDYTHPDLAANMWRNPGEVAGDRRDNDGNGYVDDVYGYDFRYNDSNPMDDNGHGTHVAGTIAAVGNNARGVAGVSWNSKIMALKFLGADGSGDTAGAIRALDYARNMKVKYGVNVRLTNNSWGGGGYSQALQDAIARTETAGMLFVAAAGNGDEYGIGVNNDVLPSHPANSPSGNVISVAATDRNDRLATFSNYGATTVDLAAPGVDIASTYPGNQYVYMSGTSMAAPAVSGVAALAWSLKPTAIYQQVKDAILQGADKVAGLAGKVLTGGRLNARGALNALQAPAAPTGLEVVRGDAKLTLRWTDASTNEQDFRVERSTTGATGTFTEIAKVAANATTYEDAAVVAGTTYTYRVRATSAGGTSAYSNSAGATAVSTVAAAGFAGVDAATQGWWKNRYGADGYQVIGEAASYPTYATVTPSGHSSWVWESTSTDVRALEKSGATADRMAATWYSAGQMNVDLNLKDGQTHRVALYMLDYEGAGRSQRVEVIDAADGRVLDTRDVSDFVGGKYLVYDLRGNVRVRITNTGPVNAVLSGVFFGGAHTTATTSAGFAGADDSTLGDWQSQYGAQGYNVIGAAAGYPAYASVTTTGQSFWTWEGTSVDPRALRKPGSTDRVAATWYSSGEMNVDVKLTDGQKHRISLYMFDYEGAGRAQRIDVLDAVDGRVLDSREVSNFVGGRYLAWEVGGHVRFRITRTGASNAVLSGLFFDGASAAATETQTATASASGGVFSNRPIVAKSAAAKRLAGAEVDSLLA
jgi:hypothetical protein